MSETERGSRDTSLDFAKGWLIVLVVLGHLIQYLLWADGEAWDDPVYTAIYMFHMPLFMTISGVLAARSLRTMDFRTLLAKRARDYMVPVLVWTALHAGALLAVARWKGSAPEHLSFPNLQGPLWFVWSLFLSTALVAISRLAGRLFPLAFAATTVFVLLLPEAGCLPLFKSVYPFFQLGILVQGTRWLEVVDDPWMLGAFGISAVACYRFWDPDTFIYVSGMDLDRQNLPFVAIRIAAGFFAGASFLGISRIVHRRFGGRMVQRLGRNSLYVYALQSYLLAWTYPWFPSIGARFQSLEELSGSPVPGWLAAAFCAFLASVILERLGTAICKFRWPARLLFGRDPVPRAPGIRRDDAFPAGGSLGRA